MEAMRFVERIEGFFEISKYQVTLKRLFERTARLSEGEKNEKNRK